MSDHINLDALADYLDSDRSPDDCMGLSDLDGFLTGIIIGPELLMPGEWLPVIWGHDEPEFESHRQAEEIISLIMGRYNEIATGFIADPERFEPIFWRRPTGAVIVIDWAAGFVQAVEMRRAAWEPLCSHRRARLLLEPLRILADDGARDHERVPDDRWKEFYASRSDVIPNCVLGIFNFWKDQQEHRRPRPRRERRPRR